MARFGAVNQSLVVVGSEIEAALVAILEMAQQAIGEAAGEVGFLIAKIRSHQGVDRGEQKRIVIQIGAQVAATAAPGGEQSV